MALTVAAGKKPKSLHLVLRNTSQARLHIHLGIESGRGESLDAFSFTIIDPHGRAMKFEASGIGAVAGVLAYVDEEIAPGHAWSGNIDLHTLVLTEHLENPLTADQLETGTYTIQAIFQGRTGLLTAVDPRPYWLGTIESPPMSYVQSK